MTLKETISTWNEAVVLFDNEDLNGSLKTFRSILDSSAKIPFNIGCILLRQKNYESAIQNFHKTLSRDRFLAVGFFQRGVAYLCQNRISEAKADFSTTLSLMRDCPLIDYKQLGMQAKLYAWQVLLNSAIVESRLGNHFDAKKFLQRASKFQNEAKHERIIQEALCSVAMCGPISLAELPSDCIFRPCKAFVSNLTKQDFLGKAQVVSSIEQDDKFVGFEGVRKSHSVPNSPNYSKKHLSPDQDRRVPPSLTPPPPSRAPPPPSRPPPRLLTSSVQYSSDIHKPLLTSKPIPPSHAPPRLLDNHSNARYGEKVKPQRPPPPFVKKK